MGQPEIPDNASACSEPVPKLTHQSSLESAQQPATPALEKLEKDLTADPKSHHEQTAIPEITIVPSEPQDAPVHDPYADDHIIPLTFDKNQSGKLSRGGSVRRMLSASSNLSKSLKSGFGTLRRKLSTRSSGTQRLGSHRRERSKDKLAPPPVRRVQSMNDISEEGEFAAPDRHSTFHMGPSFHKPHRVETYQMSAMAF